MIGGAWNPTAIAFLITIALAPVVTVSALEQGADALVRIALGWFIVSAWQFLFGILRGQRVYLTGAVVAVAVTTLAPGDLAVWQVVLALSFGTVIGELIFGGWGRNFLNGAVVTLAFLFFSFPDIGTATAGGAFTLACLPAAVGLIAVGILSWRVVAGALAGLLAVGAAFGADAAALAADGALAFGIVFLVGDPVASAATNPGRWVYGLLAGALAGLFGWSGAGTGAAQSIVFAALIASIFAPLVDHLVIASKDLARRRRHG